MKSGAGVIVLWSTSLVLLAASGCSKPSEPAAAVEEKTSIVAQMKDIDVTAKVKSALALDQSLKKFDISVVTLNGDVRLTGMVDNQGQIDHADNLVRIMEGVHSIHDELSVRK